MLQQLLSKPVVHGRSISSCLSWLVMRKFLLKATNAATIRVNIKVTQLPEKNCLKPGIMSPTTQKTDFLIQSKATLFNLWWLPDCVNNQLDPGFYTSVWKCLRMTTTRNVKPKWLLLVLPCDCLVPGYCAYNRLFGVHAGIQRSSTSWNRTTKAKRIHCSYSTPSCVIRPMIIGGAWKFRY